MTKTIMLTTVIKGVAVAVLKTEPVAVAEVAAVATARADNNQQINKEQQKRRLQ